MPTLALAVTSAQTAAYVPTDGVFYLLAAPSMRILLSLPMVGPLMLALAPTSAAEVALVMFASSIVSRPADAHKPLCALLSGRAESTALVLEVAKGEWIARPLVHAASSALGPDPVMQLSSAG